MADRMMMSSMM